MLGHMSQRRDMDTASCRIKLHRLMYEARQLEGPLAAQEIAAAFAAGQLDAKAIALL
jgi:hypothetical protein